MDAPRLAPHADTEAAAYEAELATMRVAMARHNVSVKQAPPPRAPARRAPPPARAPPPPKLYIATQPVGAELDAALGYSLATALGGGAARPQRLIPVLPESAWNLAFVMLLPLWPMAYFAGRNIRGIRHGAMMRSGGWTRAWDENEAARHARRYAEQAQQQARRGAAPRQQRHHTQHRAPGRGGGGAAAEGSGFDFKSGDAGRPAGFGAQSGVDEQRAEELRERAERAEARRKALHERVRAEARRRADANFRAKAERQIAEARSPYRALGLPEAASAAEVKAAYFKLAKALHPDSNGGRKSERWPAVQRAYEALGRRQQPG